MLNTVVRKCNRVIMLTTVGVADRVLSRLVNGDPDTMSRADMQWDALMMFVDRHPLASWNPLFFLDKALVEELAFDLREAQEGWEVRRDMQRQADVFEAARRDMQRNAEYQALKERILKKRATGDYSAEPTVERTLSKVTDLAFCTDGIGDAS